MGFLRGGLELLAEAQRRADATQFKALRGHAHPQYSEEMLDAFPLYCQLVGFPPGCHLLADRVTKNGTGRKRTIELPIYPVKLTEEAIRAGHAKLCHVGIEDVTVTRDPNNARLVHIRTITNGYFKSKKTVKLPPVTKDRIPFAWDTEGIIRWIEIGGKHALHMVVAGMTGSGKSNTMEHLMGCYAELGWEIWLGDPTGGSEFGDYVSLASQFADEAETCAELLQRTVDEIKTRYTVMGQRGEKVWSGTPLVVFIDEIPAVLDKTMIMGEDEKGKPIKQGLQGQANLKTVVMRGRRARVTLIVGIQSPRADDMSGVARSQFPYVVCHAVKRQEESQIVLGAGSVKAGLNAATLPLGGRALLSAPSVECDPVQVFEARAMADLRLKTQPGKPQVVVTERLRPTNPSESNNQDFHTIPEDGMTGTNEMKARLSHARSFLNGAAKSEWAGTMINAMGFLNAWAGPTEIGKKALEVDGTEPPGSRIHGVLQTLTGKGVVEKDETKGKYRLTPAGREAWLAVRAAEFYAD